jgi:hypothetical protein
MSLNDLAELYGTDKQTNGHDYVTVYESLFGKFREDTFNFLEIGICRGKSHKMWRDYFPNATIYGIDCREYGEDSAFRALDRIVVDQVDQGDRAQLTEYAKKGPWKIIIDDGSHIATHQKQTFEILWDQVEPGGHYVIEDTHTSYSTYKMKPTSRRPDGKNRWIDSDETLIDRMLKITDEVCSTPYNLQALRDYFVEGETDKLTEYQRTIESIEFRLGMVIIKKRGGENSR